MTSSFVMPSCKEDICSPVAHAAREVRPAIATPPRHGSWKPPKRTDSVLGAVEALIGHALPRDTTIQTNFPPVVDFHLRVQAGVQTDAPESPAGPARGRRARRKTLLSRRAARTAFLRDPRLFCAVRRALEAARRDARRRVRCTRDVETSPRVKPDARGHLQTGLRGSERDAIAAQVVSGSDSRRSALDAGSPRVGLRNFLLTAPD